MHQGELSSRFLFSASLMEAALPTRSFAGGWTLAQPCWGCWAWGIAAPDQPQAHHSPINPPNHQFVHLNSAGGIPLLSLQAQLHLQSVENSRW